MSNLSLHIYLPEHWSEQTAVILGQRLAESELPPELMMQLWEGSDDPRDGSVAVIGTWDT